MKKFWLVFEDQMDLTQKSVDGPFEAESREALALQFQLQRRTGAPHGSLPAYWDGKRAGDVVIYIVLARDHQIQTPEHVSQVAHRLHCDWY